MSEQIAYGRTVTVDMEFGEAVERVKSLLQEQGFGILSEIDVGKTMKAKIGEDFPPYLILGACTPQLAHRALLAENQLGLLLPCNVVVQSKDGKTVVSAVDAQKMLDIVGNPELRDIARDANERLQVVIGQVSA